MGAAGATAVDDVVVGVAGVAGVAGVVGTVVVADEVGVAERVEGVGLTAGVLAQAESRQIAGIRKAERARRCRELAFMRKQYQRIFTTS